MLSFSTTFGQNIIYIEHTLLAVLSVEYEENYSTVLGTDEQTSRSAKERSYEQNHGIGGSKTFIALTTVSKVRKEKKN